MRLPKRIDLIRAAVMSTLTSGASMLVLLSLISLDTAQLAAITVFINNATFLGAILTIPGVDEGEP